jgi:hypothetical protein
MLDPLPAWLRDQRLARHWNKTEMGRQLHRAAKTTGDHTIPSMALLTAYVRRWERGEVGLTERYQLHYCTALGIPLGQFGPPGDPTQPADTASPDLNGTAAASPGPDPTLHQCEPGNGRAAARSPLPVRTASGQPPPAAPAPVNGASPPSVLTVTITIELPPGATAGITVPSG